VDGKVLNEATSPGKCTRSIPGVRERGTGNSGWLGQFRDGILKKGGGNAPENLQGMLPSVTFACYPLNDYEQLMIGKMIKISAVY
jgi:hypothetical protein